MWWVNDEYFIRLGLFTQCWEFMADEGTCDELGGAEYKRVLKEYIDLDLAPDIRQFILERANIPARVTNPA